MAQAQLGADTFGTFGELLRHLRRRARLTQRELGAGVGYSEAQITRLESGQRLPDPVIVRARFVEALGLQADDPLAAQLIALARQAVRASPSTSGSPHLTNLPVQLTRFVGRERELAELVQLIRAHRLVTLTGSGGVGKTRLALEVAATLLSEFTDGVWLVELAPLSHEALADPTPVARAIVALFRLPDDPSRTPAQVIADHLRDKYLLLLLDNCEHVVAACAQRVEAFLRACPRLHLLTTSREPLRVPGEVAWRVPSLSTPDQAHLPPLEQVTDYEAVQLFLQHAASVQPAFALTPANMRAVAHICQRLDGIALAIEMAARVAAMSVQEIAARLDDVFALLTSGRRTVLMRQQTLHATFEWSYQLLSEPERILLARLSVFAGGWTAEAAEAVCADTPHPSQSPLAKGDLNGVRGEPVLLLLLQLVQKSLVVANEDTGADARTRTTCWIPFTNLRMRNCANGASMIPFMNGI